MIVATVYEALAKRTRIMRKITTMAVDAMVSIRSLHFASLDNYAAY
jgi:hypothetical protein